MVDFDKNMNAHRFAVDNLFRKYKLNGRTDIDKTRAGFEAHGEGFILELLAITVPPAARSHYETTLEARLPEPLVVGLRTPGGYTVDPAGATTPTTGRGWAFFEKLLGAGIEASAAIGQIRQNANGPEQAAQAAQADQAQAGSTKILYIAAAALLAGILLIFALKK